MKVVLCLLLGMVILFPARAQEKPHSIDSILKKNPGQYRFRDPLKYNKRSYHPLLKNLNQLSGNQKDWAYGYDKDGNAIARALQDNMPVMVPKMTTAPMPNAYSDSTYYGRMPNSWQRQPIMVMPDGSKR